MWLARLLFGLIFITLVTGLFHVKEGFESDLPVLHGVTAEQYRVFVSFYNPFMETWEKAITTAVGLERPPPKEGDPIPTIRREEMNRYVQLLSQQLDGTLPEITEPLPETLTGKSMASFVQLLDKTPPEAFLRATEWMNARIKESHAKKDAALKGEGFKVEGFATSETCSEFVKCMDDPEFLDKLAAAQEKRQAKKSASQQDALSEKMKSILNQSSLQQALQTNTQLRSESDRIQNQAQSGDMLKSMDLPSVDELSSKFTLPEGADALDRMKKEDPEKYKKMKENQKPYLEMKQLFDQINRNLR